MSVAGKRLINKRNIMILIGCLLATEALAQKKTPVLSQPDDDHVMVTAGNYKDNFFRNLFWGKHYRQEWNTAIVAPIMELDTVAGGLRPIKAGGGRQTKSLRLADARGREYVLRSVDKSFGRMLPKIYRNTFWEDLLNDQGTFDHPYAAFTIAPMADAAGVYHTTPRLEYVPQQDALDDYNEAYGDRLYLFEERADDNWEENGGFGHTGKIISTEKVLSKLLKNNKASVDQVQYVRSRLFDMFIGDWGRHEDQWRWGEFDKNGKKIYKPIPRDRDHAYARFGGIFPDVVISMIGVPRIQAFGKDIKDVKGFNFPARYMDRHCANEMTEQEWVDIAKDLQVKLNDHLIEQAVRDMPPQTFSISGEEIIEKLKSRRKHLTRIASDYYKFLARHVDITGSEGREFFEVDRVNDDETTVDIYRINKDGERSKSPYYSRTFYTDETQDVRLYGIGGHDVFTIKGNVNASPRVRIIGGPDYDSIVDNSTVGGLKKRTLVYDDENNYIQTSGETKLHLKDDSAIHAYDYKEYEYHKKGMRVQLYYNNPDRVFIGLGYGFKHHAWRKDPWGWDQAVYLRYSISQNALSTVYEGKFYQVAGKWNLFVTANYDAIRWTNFYGLGNETDRTHSDNRYYRLSTNELLLNGTLNRQIGKHHHIDLSAFVQAIQVVNTPGHFVADNFTPSALHDFQRNNYASARAAYTYQNVNNPGIPTRGVAFYAGATFTQNIVVSTKNFETYASILHLYIPLVGKFGLSIRSGATSVSGTPEFYQYASVGGPMTMRGFYRDRYWGNTSVFNSNELRYITNVRTRIMNGKAGLLVLLDDGRVWLDGEHSNEWHYGYGGGFLLAPFNKFNVEVTYATSDPDGGHLQIRFNKLL